MGTQAKLEPCRWVRRTKGRAFAAAMLWAALWWGMQATASASLTVLVGEPFDSLGRTLPVGHTTVYLDRVCADGPLQVRMCEPGEPQGVAIARYNRIGQYDWLATPVLEFFYATDRREDILSYATPETVAEMRARYRRRYLGDLFPDGAESTKENEEWWESAGMAYTRRFWGYRIETTREQDERFVAALNRRSNRRAYRAYTANCANFAADLVNVYFPGMVKRNRNADLGFMLPKQVARCVYEYGKAHPALALEVVDLPQVPGTLTRSWKVRGGAETFIKTGRFIAPMLVVQPELAGGLALLYLDHGRWKLGQGATVETPEAFLDATEGDASVAGAGE